MPAPPAVFLAGCGGASDGSDITPKTIAPSVKVFGDSIMDSGTFGYKFTIQSADPAKPFLIFPELVAANFGVSNLCSFFRFNGTTFIPNTACTSFAVGGGRVNNLTNASAPSNSVPFSITYQMAVGSATLAPSDLVIIDGGGNDLADLTGAYLGATTPTGVGTYIGLLNTLHQGQYRRQGCEQGCCRQFARHHCYTTLHGCSLRSSRCWR